MRINFWLTLLVTANVAACLDFHPTTPGEESPASISVLPLEACVVNGGELQLRAVVVDVNGRPYSPAAIGWTTSDSGVAHVSSEGLTTAIGPGLAVITASVSGRSAQSSVRVTRGLVSFVIDDGHSTDWTVKKGIFDEKRAVGSLAIVSRWGGPRQTTDSELRKFEAEGWEILAHSRTHVPEDALSPVQLEWEIEGARQDLAARGFQPTIHVYPYGDHPAAAEMVAKEHFEAALTAGGGANRLPIADWFALRRINLGTAYARPGQNTLTFYERLIDSTRVGGRWLIFMVHELAPGDSADLAAVLDYVHERRLPVLTVSNALVEARNAPPMRCTPGSLSP